MIRNGLALTIWFVGLFLLSTNAMGQEKQASHQELLASALELRVPKQDGDKIPLTLYLEILEKQIDERMAKSHPQFRCRFYINQRAFQDVDSDFNVDTINFEQAGRLENLTVRASLRLACEPLRAVFVFQKDFIEILPEASYRKELGLPEDAERALHPLVWENFRKVGLEKVIHTLSEK